MNYSVVYPQLYVGSAPTECDEVADFDFVVFAAREWQVKPRAFACVETLSIPLSDGEYVGRKVVQYPMTHEERRHAIYAASAVAKRVARGQRVLVTCWMGLNRSALVASLAMLMLHPTMQAEDAMRLVRIARGRDALGNRFFVEFLLDYARRR